MQHNSRDTSWTSLLAHACWLMLPLACSSAPHASPGDSELGALEINLTAPDANGTQYRLRDATFVISSRFAQGDAGPSTIVLSSESAPRDEFLTEPLLPGSYFVDLQPGWRMEEVTASGAVDTPAVLLSSESVSFFIQRFRTSSVRYQFGVNGDPLDFGGQLSIGISVISHDAGAP